jgi:hypothetical protein
MISKPKIRLYSLMALAALALQTAPSLADTAKPAPREAGIDQLDCRTLLRLGGDERAYTLLYFHGFVSGRNNQMRLEVQDMAMVTDQVVDHCIDHPKENLLPVFEKYRKVK